MEKLILSPNFTIDDIHKIREYHYEMTKNMTVDEWCAYFNNTANRVLKEMAERKAEKAKEINHTVNHPD